MNSETSSAKYLGYFNENFFSFDVYSNDEFLNFYYDDGEAPFHGHLKKKEGELNHLALKELYRQLLEYHDYGKDRITRIVFDG